MEANPYEKVFYNKMQLIYTQTYIHVYHAHMHTHAFHLTLTEPAYRGQGLGLETTKLMMGYGMHCL